MWISANRTQLAWTPLLGWILLSCAAPVAQAQQTPATAGGASPATTTTGGAATPTAPVPAGGAAPAPPSTVYPDEPVRRDSTATESTTPAARTPVRSGVSGPQGPNPSVLSGGGASVGSSVSTSVSSSVQNPIGGGGAARDELGVTLGAFRLFPQISLNVGADSNVFAQKAADSPVGSLTPRSCRASSCGLSGSITSSRAR